MPEENGGSTFAYLLLACDSEVAGEMDWRDWSVIDIIASFIEVEEQAGSTYNVWAFDWGNFMDRVAPVQLTDGWSPLPRLIALGDDNGFEATYIVQDSESERADCIVRFEQRVAAEQRHTPSFVFDSPHARRSEDIRRFEEVFAATMRLAVSRQRSLLFIGGFGLAMAYEDDIEPLNPVIFSESGMLVCERRPPGSLCGFADATRSIAREPKASKRESEASEREQCVTHMKQLTMAALMYADDNDDHLPVAASWWEEIGLYAGFDTTLLECPESASPYGYAMNQRLSRVLVNDVREPDRTVLFFESDLDIVNASGGTEALAPGGRHNGQYTLAFLDGHVEVMDADDVSQICWSP